MFILVLVRIGVVDPRSPKGEQITCGRLPKQYAEALCPLMNAEMVSVSARLVAAVS